MTILSSPSPFAVARNVLGAAAAVAALGSTVACQRAPAAQTAEPTPSVHVETAKAAEVDAPIVLRLTGTLRGMREAALAANASGRVLRTSVERGDEVAAGAVVAQLDTSSARLSLAESKVAVANSLTQDEIDRTECARSEKLLEKDAISPAEYDQVTAKCKTAPLNVEAARAREAIAAKNVGDGIIRAPFAGVIAERYVSVGEYVQSSSKVVTIAQIGELRLELAIPEANMGSAQRGADVAFTVPAYPGKTFHGTVRFVSGSVRDATRDIIAEAIVPNEDKLLRPGMFADASIQIGSRKLPAVPKTAIFERQDKPRVFVVDSGKLVERVVQLDVEKDGLVAVRDGVKSGDTIALGDPARLVNGARVD
jgi:RND family efflux transporter MFP subunit